MSALDKPGFEDVTAKAMDLAEYGLRYQWHLDELLGALKQAWIYAHEDKLRLAKYAVERAGQS